MAFASAFRRILSRASTPSLNTSSQLASVRFNSTLVTLTSPKLFISGISRNTTDESLRNAFAPFGTLYEAKIITDRETGRPRGFAFVTYETVEEAEKAREGMNAKYLDDWVIYVDPARAKEFQSRPPPRQDLQSNPLGTNAGFATNKAIGWSG